jgi:hypothetical protein
MFRRGPAGVAALDRRGLISIGGRPFMTCMKWEGSKSYFWPVRIAVVPLLSYADPKPFIKWRFLRSRRVLLHAYFALLSEGSEPEPVNSFNYVGVFNSG